MLQIENGKIDHPIQVDGPLALYGMALCNIHVLPGGKLSLFGMACDGVTVEAESWAILNGTVTGDVVNNGGDIFISGLVNGRVVQNAGSTVVHPNALVRY